MKVHLNLSIDIKTAEIVKEARQKGFNVSKVFSSIMESLAENDYQYPVKYDPESAI